jgi:hypothetical protein
MPPRLQQAAHSTGPLCRSARLAPWVTGADVAARRMHGPLPALTPACFREARTQGRFDRGGVAGALRFNSDSYQIFSALAVSALPGFSSVQNPILAMMG